jgi:pectinesterase
MMSMLKRIVLSIFMLTSVSISILAQQQDTLVVSRDGTGKYRTIQEAVEAVLLLFITPLQFILRKVYTRKN